MFRIKSKPRDFIVREIPDLAIKDEGKYTICLLKKRNYTTLRAMEQISRVFDIPLKNIGYAGTKDKKAVTYQFVSIKNCSLDRILNLRLKDIDLQFIGYSDSPLSLGDLKGNEFVITIRDLGEMEIERILSKEKKGKIMMPNYFGEQRFSRNNKDIGKHLLKSEFKQAVELILGSGSDYKRKIEEFLEKNLNNYAAALRLVPMKLLKLYVHAYQSYIWNKTLKDYLGKSRENLEIPIIGFGTEIEDSQIKAITRKIMDEENITYRDFVSRKIPEISSEGDLRKAFVRIKDIRILEKKKNLIRINFKLDKGCYATEAVKFLSS
jgi:tRNA pseudouridine13 synthase